MFDCSIGNTRESGCFPKLGDHGVRDLLSKCSGLRHLEVDGMRTVSMGLQGPIRLPADAVSVRQHIRIGDKVHCKGYLVQDGELEDLLKLVGWWR